MASTFQSTEEEESSDEIGEWTPVKPSQPSRQSKPTATTKSTKSRPEHLSRPPSPIFEEDVKAARKQTATRRSTRSTSNALVRLEQELDALSLGGRDSTVIIPNKQARKAAVSHVGPEAKYVPHKGEVDGTKKKKRSACFLSYLHLMKKLIHIQTTWQEVVVLDEPWT